jgi:hypothetical protein
MNNKKSDPVTDIMSPLINLSIEGINFLLKIMLKLIDMGLEKLFSRAKKEG